MRLTTAARGTRHLLLAAATLACCAPGFAAAGTGRIPITTKSEEARRLYLQGRDLLEKLRAPEARKLFEQAVAKDPDFALAQLGLANTAPSPKAFFEDLQRAVAAAPKASPAEQQMILGFDAGVRSDPARQKEQYEKLVAAYPEDARALNLLGNYYFGRQDYAQAVELFTKVVKLAPDFSQPYNQLGYAYRFLGRYDEAEAAFKKYVELIPDDPNPYDSYAELLMKRGRFQESIASYQKALAQDPHFVASYVGIALDQLYMGHSEEARATLEKLEQQARNPGERRTALGRVAFTYLMDGDADQAISSIRAQSAASAPGDDTALSGDAAFTGTILLENGRFDEAAREYARALKLIEEASVPAAVKAAVERGNLSNRARLAVAAGRLDEAEKLVEEYAAAVAGPKVAFELRQSHELQGLLALARKDYGRAAQELALANQQDPRVLYNLALAEHGRGARDAARKACQEAADHNGLNFNYAFVRAKARKLLTEL
jgi:tetratricopeptide (TPR) repeat protein